MLWMTSLVTHHNNQYVFTVCLQHVDKHLFGFLKNCIFLQLFGKYIL